MGAWAGVIMNQRVLSIISICRSNPAELRRTLASFSGLDFELIETAIVDGSPGKECTAVAREFPNVPSHYIHRPGCGLYHAMNIGIDGASGNALLFINSGDALSDAERLNQLILEYRNNIQEKVLYGAHIQEIKGHHFLIKAPRIHSKDRLRNFPSHQAIILPATFCRTNKYDSSFRFLGDVVLMNQALVELEHIRIDEPIAIVAHGGISSMPGSWKSVLRHYYEMLAVFDMGAGEKLTILFQLCGRKIVAETLGRERLEKIQLQRAIRRAERRTETPSTRGARKQNEY